MNYIHDLDLLPSQQQWPPAKNDMLSIGDNGINLNVPLLLEGGHPAVLVEATIFAKILDASNAPWS